jgi:hypothetical protein
MDLSRLQNKQFRSMSSSSFTVSQESLTEHGIIVDRRIQLSVALKLPAKVGVDITVEANEVRGGEVCTAMNEKARLGVRRPGLDSDGTK